MEQMNTNNECMPEFYTPTDLMQLLHKSKNTIYALLAEDNHTLPFAVIKIGHQYLIPKQPFDRWAKGEVS